MSGHTIRLSAAVLEPGTPHGQLRWIAFRLAPLRFLAFNENLDHFMLRPRCAPAIARHFFWRVKNFLRWQLKPGGPVYTWAWRLRHPASLHRPAAYRAALAAGWAASLLRRLASPAPTRPLLPARTASASSSLPATARICWTACSPACSANSNQTPK